MDFNLLRDDPRQRVADYSAVLVLTRAAAEQLDITIAQLGAIVAAFLPSMETGKLRSWSDMDMAQAVRAIKLDLLRHQIAQAEADTGSRDGEPGRRQAARQARLGKKAHHEKTLTEQEISALDEAISQSVVASFFKFMTMRALNPDWYTPYIEETAAFKDLTT